MIPALPVFFVGAQLVVAAADNVPTLNVKPSCQQAANGSLGLTQEFDACMQSENSAREQIAQQWKDFSPADRDGCVRLTTIGTGGSYTELLTCLEMRREARKLPDDTSTKPTGTVGRKQR